MKGVPLNTNLSSHGRCPQKGARRGDRFVVVAVSAACATTAVACRLSTSTPSADAAGVGSGVESVGLVDSGPKAPEPAHRTVALATFRGGVLDECTQFDFGLAPGKDAGPDFAKGAESRLNESEKKVVANVANKTEKTTTKLAKGCADQFADRTLLAWCTVPEKSGANPDGTSVLFRFGRATTISERSASTIRS